MTKLGKKLHNLILKKESRHRERVIVCVLIFLFAAFLLGGWEPFSGSKDAGKQAAQSQTEDKGEEQISEKTEEKAETDVSGEEITDETLASGNAKAVLKDEAVRTRPQLADIWDYDLLRNSAAWQEIYANAWQYPESLLESLERMPELLEFVQAYPTAAPIVTGGITEEEKLQEYPLFLQWDARWGYAPYGDNNIGQCGCGPACLSMVIFSMTRREDATVDALAAMSTEGGYYVAEEGTAWSFMTYAANVYGVGAEQLYISESTMRERLDAGQQLICSMGPGDFAAEGHFIVIYGYNENGYLVNDPNSLVRSAKTWDYQTLSSQMNSMWAYWR